MRRYGSEITREDRIYVTTDFNAAVLYASCSSKKPTVYEVEPIGDVLPDPDCKEPGLSFQCESAKVLSSVRVDKATANQIRIAMLESR